MGCITQAAQTWGNITITGNTKPDARINMIVRFKVAVEVHDGRYSHDFRKVQIPEGRMNLKSKQGLLRT
ncbi:MAG: hypothetical protein A9957_06380 [Methanohalophilus sp. DAL1]|uniref:Uncharacterized protein n=1 Tax=Methanohalophilus euhalobius TaxID=51203 RepID=A0A3M9L7R7_9EURY|nr:MAG: hypothetical protein A9957_06380 [Methanohalophilus sp. DAL1]RNI09364.1 hypothetical protein EDD83_05270 [Methanohalophilus euhalobius]